MKNYHNPNKNRNRRLHRNFLKKHRNKIPKSQKRGQKRRKKRHYVGRIKRMAKHSRTK